MGAAPICSTVPLGPKLVIVVQYGLEYGPHHASVAPTVTAEPVEYELSNRRVPHQIRSTEDLQVA